MILGQTICPASWTIEFYGYLEMATSRQHRQIMFVFVDVNAAILPEEAHNKLDINPIYHVEVSSCFSGIKCPPYMIQKRIEITCVVCTK